MYYCNAKVTVLKVTTSNVSFLIIVCTVYVNNIYTRDITI